MMRKFGAHPRDRADLIQLLREARRDQIFDDEEESMLEGVLDVAEMQVRDIMIPRSQMVVLERDDEPGQLLETIIESGHSRFPVIGEDRDEVVGILLAKDLLRFFVESGGGRFNIREVLRPAVFIPESKRLNVLLRDFRVSRNHMAIVVDEYGGVSGLLTIEDVLEQIVGDIGDEHDPDEISYFQRESDGVYTVRALTRIEDFNEEFHTALSDEEYDTIGGLVISELGRLPRRGESVELDGIRFTVLKADRRRVYTMRARFPDAPPVGTG
ncbi:MAG: magnesium/cobalt efflux protein CorC [Gammaproteobacteria bacterium SG8_31]|nr:MAG: magnesium/cobalt efflux protein CorC [Gammaproteobacteria bacterium SG8_31]